MATSDTRAPSTKAHTREQLLRMLKRDPTSVSRAEIKAAFQDGRLGDDDLDIPTLAGMKRISELLDELEPAPPEPAPGSAKARRRATGRRKHRRATRGPAATRPLSEVDQIVAAPGHARGQPRAPGARTRDGRGIAAPQVRGGRPSGAIRRLWIAVGVMGVIAVAALVVALVR